MKLSSGRVLTAVLPWVVLVLLYLALVAKAPNFVRAGPMSVLLYSVTILGVVAMGQVCVILIGGIDLSVSNVMTFTNIVSASVIGTLATKGGFLGQHSLLFAVLACVAIGAVIGALNGVIITKLGMPDMIATLAMWTIVYGVMNLYRVHIPKTIDPSSHPSTVLTSFVTSRIFAFVTPASIVWIVVAVILIVVLRKTTFGRQVYAVGLSRGASHAAGISAVRTTIVLYVISGVCAALAGVLLTGSLSHANLDTGNNYQLWSIAAVVLGGTSIFGGRGGYGSTIAGAAIIVVLVNGLLNVLRIGTAAQDILYGVVILVMLLVFRFGSRKDDGAG
ncbi:MAG: ABC transporter permease [Propionibacteriaceae bacterium]|nr:ABC transporter permease [Propionibacteriaceae bacterium]